MYTGSIPPLMYQENDVRLNITNKNLQDSNNATAQLMMLHPAFQPTLEQQSQIFNIKSLLKSTLDSRLNQQNNIM